MLIADLSRGGALKSEMKWMALPAALYFFSVRDWMYLRSASLPCVQ